LTRLEGEILLAIEVAQTVERLEEICDEAKLTLLELGASKGVSSGGPTKGASKPSWGGHELPWHRLLR
jgi:hypothetical protein